MELFFAKLDLSFCRYQIANFGSEDNLTEIKKLDSCRITLTSFLKMPARGADAFHRTESALRRFLAGSKVGLFDNIF